MSEDQQSVANLPEITETDLRSAGFPSGVTMAPGLALFLNDRIYRRCRAVAVDMSTASGMMPKHLINKPAACFAIVSLSITWNLSPYMVARCTYETPGGSVGFMGSLVMAILETSGRIEGAVKFTHSGDWEKLRGKFRIQETQKGGKIPVSTWKPEEEAGLYVVVSARLKGESEDRVLRFDLNEAFPRNSPLWATAPQRQICYTAVRSFANIIAPGLLMGVPFDVDPLEISEMKDITPARPERNEFVRTDQKMDEQPLAGTQQEQTNSGGEQAEEPTQQTQESQQLSDHAQPLDDKGYEQAIADLAKCEGVPGVADLRKKIAPLLDAKRAATWDAACDLRTNAIVNATAKRGKR